MAQWVVHGERPLYESGWVRLTLVDVELPSGERFEHHVVRLDPVAAAVVVDAEERVLLLWRHRFITNTWGWELPTGIVEPGEEPAEAAAREVLEETGWRPGPLRLLVSYEPNNGISDSRHHLFVGEAPIQLGPPTDTDESERIEWVPLAKVADLIREGELVDGPSLVGLLMVLAERPSAGRSA
ncbi:MAG: NUDIX hydrolase [Acidimicrobiales bacterium]